MVTIPDCPPGFEIFESRCYFFVKTKLKWHEAIHACAAYPDTQLIAIDSPEEQAFINNTILGREGKHIDIIHCFNSNYVYTLKLAYRMQLSTS